MVVKFYVHLPTGKRFLSKGDVLRYANERKVSRCDMDVLCDTSTDDNVLAHLEFNPDGLPDGWVKEVIFRKYNDGIRKDPPQSMLKRLRVEGQIKQKSVTAPIFDKEPNGQTSNHADDGSSAGAGLPQSGPKGDKYETLKATDRKRVSSDTDKQPGEEPNKISKQTDESTSDCDMSSHKETDHVDVKFEMAMMDGDDIPNEKTLKCTPKEKHATVVQQAVNKLAGGDLSTIKQNHKEAMTAFHPHEQENDKLIKISKKVTSLAVQKFYTRRSSNQALGSKKV